MKTEVESPVLSRVRTLVEPIAADLGLDIYDLEFRGGTLRLTLDTPAGSAAGITLDVLSLATRLVSKELDAHDPVPSRYTLEVTSPGVERPLRTPDHFRREVGKDVAIRLHDVESADRRVRGVIAAADDLQVTVRVGGELRPIPFAQIDRAHTVFEWGPQPKPGGRKPKPDTAPRPPASEQPSASMPSASEPSESEPSASEPSASEPSASEKEQPS